MGIVMPGPTKIGAMYYYRVRVPADVRDKVKGKRIAITLNDSVAEVRVGDAVKVSLQTYDPAEAKLRFQQVQAQVNERWEAVRHGPQRLTHKQCLALAGEIFEPWVEIFDEDPRGEELWQGVIAANELAMEPKLPIYVALMPDDLVKPNNKEGLEARFGAFVDVALRKRGLLVDEETRQRLLAMVAKAMNDAAKVNLRKAGGDYSDEGKTNRFPKFERPSAPVAKPETEAKGVTFGKVIDEEVKKRASGRTGKPMPQRTVSKYRRLVEEFSAYRGSDKVETITAREVDRWIDELLDEGELSNNTIRQRLMNLKTVVGWARSHSLGELFPTHHPLDQVKPPPKDSDVPQGERAFKLQEARAVLLAARKETKADLRWLPWICAYSGARINEVAQLHTDDFKQAEGVSYFHINTMGARSLKTEASQRRVPIHPDLIAEGLLEFIDNQRMEGRTRIFPVRSQNNVRKWVREDLRIMREHLRPNHGWRHLFEDMAGAMQDSARRYITGPATGKSEEEYGGSEAKLPALAAQIALVPSYLDKRN